MKSEKLFCFSIVSAVWQNIFVWFKEHKKYSGVLSHSFSV
jgi:hypothetical protein